MSLFITLSEEQFIQEYWQKHPLFVPDVFQGLSKLIDGDELAGIACDEEAESRIITGKDIDGDWTCRQGPFTESDFANLPEKNWTLLVQGVDQWDENIRSLLNYFTFLPKWRLEDIMASYAPIGGGVGPHFDYYDVFLIQVSGTRQWHIGQNCDEDSALQDNTDVKLLTAFTTQETYEVKAGDMLYVPAGVAHWGSALTDDCITFSVGFRAPSEKEIIEETLENLMQKLSENNRYKDTIDAIDKHPYKINASVQDNLNNLLQQITPEQLQHSIQQAFGQLVTDIRYPVYDQEKKDWTVEAIQTHIQSKGSLKLEHYTYSRFAFNEYELFVNGEAYSADENFSRMVCDCIIDSPITDQQASLLIKLMQDDYLAINC